MTYREKLQKEHPEFASILYEGGCLLCPKSYGYGPEYNGNPHCEKQSSCTECWNREYTKEQTEGEKEMAVKVTTRKTKAELLDEIKNLTKEVEKLERYKQYEEAASELGALRDAFINEGFTRDEAITLIVNTISNLPKLAVRK